MHRSGQYGGETALIHAAQGGHAECVRLLLQAGADADACAQVRNRWELRVALLIALHARELFSVVP